jgi:glycosyltransferase 2 family protein
LAVNAEVATELPETHVEAPPTRRRLLALAARLLVTAALLAGVTYAAVDQWSQVRDTITSIAWPSLVLALLAALAGIAANVRAWHAVLGALGQRGGVVELGRFYLVGQLGKYLPGSVWAFVLQMELAKRAGVPRAVGFSGLLITLGISTTTALLVGLFGLPALFAVGGVTPWLVLGLAPIALVCVVPPVLTRLVRLTLRLLRRRQVPITIGWSNVGQIMGWSALAWVLFGTHLWLLANAMAGPGVTGWVRCVGAFALAMTAGMIAVVAPSGIGVREAVIVAALAVYLPVGAALGLALASRLVFTIADLIAASAAALSGVRVLRSAPSTVS